MNKILTVILLIGINALYVSAKLNICLDFRNKADVFLSEERVFTNSFLNPIFLPDFPIKFDHPAIRVDCDFKNLSIWNVTYTKTNYFKYNQLVNISFPDIYLEADYYNLTGNIGELFDIFGIGAFWCRVTNFSVSFSVLGINLNATDFCVPVSLDIDLQHVKMNFTNFMDDPDLGDLMNKAFSTITPEIIRDIWEAIKERYDPSIEEYINSLINGLLWTDEEFRIHFEDFIKRTIQSEEDFIS